MTRRAILATIASAPAATATAASVPDAPPEDAARAATIAALAQRPIGPGTVWLDDAARAGRFAWRDGDFRGRTDGVMAVESRHRGAAQGAWVRVADHVDPRWFGARADGQADDRAALQACFDAVRIWDMPMVVRLRGSYRIADPGLQIDARLVSIDGQGTIDARAMTKGAAIRLRCSLGSPAGNSWGQRGQWSGNLLILGPGAGSAVDGLVFDSDVEASNVHVTMTRIALAHFRVGHCHRGRSYNSVFVDCDLMFCGTGVHWERSADNGERQTYIGCTFANGGLCIANDQPNGAIYLTDCSLDYTDLLIDANGGRVYATDCHFESHSWASGKARWPGTQGQEARTPIRVRGDLGMVRIVGGWIVFNAQRTPTWTAQAFAEIQAPAEMTVEGATIHALQPRGLSPSCWSIGTGRLVLRGNSSFEELRLPDRLHPERTALVDPAFAAATWPDIVSISKADGAIRHRYEADAVTLTKVPGGHAGRHALQAERRGQAGGLLSIDLATIEIGRADRVMAGAWYRTTGAPVRNGLSVYWVWAKREGFGADGRPVYAHRQVAGGMDLDWTPEWRMIASNGLQSLATAPDWASHFVVEVSLMRAPAGCYLFSDIWVDRW